ncbi:MAG: efflux RND transporter periplasmic adaptor subunit [Rhodoferax sp.]
MPVQPTPTPDDDVQALLRQGAKPAWWRRRSVWFASFLIAASAFSYWLWLQNKAKNSAPVYVTEPVTRGKITLTITANGTLQPTRTVNIGSELSGTVRRVLVDVNDTVKKGQVLVELDTDKLRDQVVRAQSALELAQAQLAQAQATHDEAQANLARLEDVAQRSGGQVPSAAELDTARASVRRAQAGLASAQANVVSAKATLSTEETNVSKASIRSPIDGVILTRSVDPGNAVAASLQAVTLLTIAEDLRQMRLVVAVDEADVGRVAVGQQASFTVSAFPGRRFPARITRVAYGSTITDNVVTYPTQLDVRNDDLSLHPGMTATASIIAAEHQDVLLVPNAALRYQPQNTEAAPQKGGSSLMLVPRMPRTGPKKAAGGQGRQVWVLENGQPVAVAVTPGISDGRLTEIVAGELKEGQSVIVDQRNAKP